MSCVRIIDTSVLCNLLHVPNMDQNAEIATEEFGEAQDNHDVFLLPVAVIYETGNHIAHVGNGSQRRVLADAFVDLLRQAFAGDLPFTPTPVPNNEEMLAWIDEFPDWAMREMGFVDLSIRKVWESQCELNLSRRVMIWSYDTHLQGYDRPPRV
ncbi:MAG TPA: hypothetical protein VE913_10850 [Longimicrobium sp.]|nr:hypothetical protein [Longimicrobium sp.]